MLTFSFLRQLREVAEILAKSGAYEGASASALYARMIPGAALGLDPVTACSNISFGKGGQLAFKAALQAALLAKHERYAHRIVEASDEKCVIEFSRDGQVTGCSTFTLAEAKRAGLTSKSVWQSYPGDLLFARALTRGIRRYCPGLLTGHAAYTIEELGGDVREPMALQPVEASPVLATAANAPNPAPVAVPAGPVEGKATREQLQDLVRLKATLAIPDATWKEILGRRGVQTARDLDENGAAEMILRLQARTVADQLEDQIRLDRGQQPHPHDGSDTTRVDGMRVELPEVSGPSATPFR